MATRQGRAYASAGDQPDEQRACPVPRQPTLETVAAVSGFSRATVSRVINGSTTVAPEIRQAVEVAVEQVGYVPNRAARSLVTRRTDSIALVVREAVEFGVADPYLSSVIVTASQSLAGTGRQLAVMMARNDADHAKLSTYVRGGHVDGVILLSLHDSDPLPAQLARANVPVVIGCRPWRTPLAGTSSVDSDNVGGGRLAAEHLLERGRHRLAMVVGPMDMTASVDRLDGFLSAVRAAGGEPPTIVHGTYTRESGEEAAREILRRLPEVDGVFAGSDLMAAGVLRALRAAGRRVPEEIAVVGFDNVELSMHTDPPLTTIEQPIALQAQLMVELLLTRIDGAAEDDQVVLPTQLVVRGTT
ncbi:MAG TPA: LacI family DNA-binding transcriptional regulator [Kineosporiaceae bacterium]